MKLPPVLTGIVLDPTAGTLDFSALGAGFDPRTVLAVLHEPTNRFLFAKGRSGLGYASIAGSVMKLAVDTTGLVAGPLTGFRDDGALIATDARLEACRALIATTNATLSNLYTSIGTPADVATGSDGAAGSLIAKVTRLLGTQSGIATVLAAIRDRLPTTLVGGRLSVDSSGVTQPISAAALPLPAGAAADATLTGRLGTLGQKTGAGSAPVVIASDQSAVPIQGGNASAVKTDGSGVTQPISVAALPLPAGAATATAQATSNTALGAPADAAYAGAGSPSIIGALKGLYAAMIAATPAGANVIGKVGLDQTTPGTTNGVVVNASALPAGAAQDGSDPAAPAVANQGTGLRGWLATIAALCKLGTAARVSSSSVTLATDDPSALALGTGADAAWTGAGSGSLVALLKSLYSAATTFVEAASGTATTASANTLGATRDAGANPAWAKFNTTVATTQAGTIIVQACNDGATWATIATLGLGAGAANTVSVAVTSRYYRALFNNGTTAGSLGLFNTSFTRA